MKCFPTLAVATAAAVLAVLSPAQARPTVSTSYSYYSVSGDTLSQVYRTMVANAPSANGTRGYGVTTASPGSQMSISHCKVTGRYQVGVNVMIRLPRASGTKLSSAESAQWNNFVGFVKRHEEKHRAIWASCAADFERKFRAGAPSDCSSAHSRAMTMWRQMVSACMPKQASFDAAQRSVLKAHPFMKYASR